jgi:rRNA-processing protein FCF1
MKEQRAKNKEGARMAFNFIKTKNIKILGEEKQKSLYMRPNSKEVTVDDAIVEYADSDTIVATQDKLLKKRLISKGINTIILRGKQKLEFGC